MLGLDLSDLEELSKKEKVVKKYMEKVKKLNEMPFLRDYLTKEEDERKIRNTMKYYGRKEGIEDTARNFLKLGVNTVEQIAEATGLSLEEVNQLKIELKK